MHSLIKTEQPRIGKNTAWSDEKIRYAKISGGVLCGRHFLDMPWAPEPHLNITAYPSIVSDHVNSFM